MGTERQKTAKYLHDHVCESNLIGSGYAYIQQRFDLAKAFGDSGYRMRSKTDGSCTTYFIQFGTQRDALPACRKFVESVQADIADDLLGTDS